jgi:hypothetical protein
VCADFFYDHILVKRFFYDWKQSWLDDKAASTPRTSLAKFKTFVASFNFVSRMKQVREVRPLKESILRAFSTPRHLTTSSGCVTISSCVALASVVPATWNARVAESWQYVLHQ